MPQLDEEMLQAAMAPGIATAKSVCEAVQQELAGEPVARVHDELVKRLQAEPFEWDDQRLQDLASSISSETSGLGASEQSDESPSAAEGAAGGAPEPDDTAS